MNDNGAIEVIGLDNGFVTKSSTVAGPLALNLNVFVPELIVLFLPPWRFPEISSEHKQHMALNSTKLISAGVCICMYVCVCVCMYMCM